ncbi:hypothetical protein PBT90_08670 [Algoriphagus halophytocola]|uniref:Uncharacterized protein n=1 Tax=Algoriphagus halophytocola TaxID=2991499 RepID=A0ABY6MKH3_9BACT|nr:MULTISPECIES: hypothetical protein [unclassified Algoriphagus]UZD23459.1 hypothetical protein OM944_02990 [Algoriphagus sp. TR-M5]WBL44754.1 hypothetical protein PBT90_08670 [Algoriphagus sp. TR-M9]
MSKNQNLGGFDMVLGLSQNTINYQFMKLHQRNFIKRKWSVMVGNVLNPPEGEKPFHEEATDAQFKGKLDRWVVLQKQIAEARQAGKWADIGKLVDTLNAEKLNFDYAWDAVLEAPTVEIISKDTHNLYFNLSFSSGNLYYRAEQTSEVKIFSLKDTLYSFTTPVGRLKINKNQMIMEADNEMSNLIRNSGISEADFRIESLFLNFENANISTFDKDRSRFPENSTLPLQIAIESYFNLMLAGSENPYVLGYGVTRPEIKSTKAMFQPTSLEYSTSFSSKTDPKTPLPGQFSAFNFMMMLDGDSPEKSQSTGVLPSSLIELGKDTTATTDGVFAIGSVQFEDYLKSLDDYLVGVFESKPDVTVENGSFQNVDGKWTMKASHDGKRKDDKIKTVYTLIRKPISNSELGITVEYEFHVHIEVHIIAKIIGEFEVKRIDLSTAGQYTYNDIKEKGKVGSFKFLIKNGKEGRFDLEHSLDAPKIAFDSNPQIIGGDFFTVLLQILSFIFLWPIKIVEGIINQIAVDLGSSSTSQENKRIEELRSLDVLNQTNKVILPLGKTYTYKNLRFLQDKAMVAYDISYAIVVEK